MLLQDRLFPRKRKLRAIHNPTWIEFRAGCSRARLPFTERGDTPDDGWAYVLDILTIGFHAHREADAIIITGRPARRQDAVGGTA